MAERQINDQLFEEDEFSKYSSFIRKQAKDYNLNISSYLVVECIYNLSTYTKNRDSDAWYRVGKGQGWCRAKIPSIAKFVHLSDKQVRRILHSKSVKALVEYEPLLGRRIIGHWETLPQHKHKPTKQQNYTRFQWETIDNLHLTKLEYCILKYIHGLLQETTFQTPEGIAYCSPKWPEIARKLGCSIAGTRKALAELVKKELVVRFKIAHNTYGMYLQTGFSSEEERYTEIDEDGVLQEDYKYQLPDAGYGDFYPQAKLKNKILVDRQVDEAIQRYQTMM